MYTALPTINTHIGWQGMNKCIYTCVYMYIYGLYLAKWHPTLMMCGQVPCDWLMFLGRRAEERESGVPITSDHSWLTLIKHNQTRRGGVQTSSTRDLLARYISMCVSRLVVGYWRYPFAWRCTRRWRRPGHNFARCQLLFSPRHWSPSAVYMYILNSHL